MSRVSVAARAPFQPTRDSYSMREAKLGRCAASIPASAAVADEAREMRLVVEARHGVVGLRLEPRAGDAALGAARRRAAAAPPCTRLCTSAVMNTVFPARDSPVTPSLSEGVTRPLAKSPMLRKTSPVAWL